jgi:hypothetical protein
MGTEIFAGLVEHAGAEYGFTVNAHRFAVTGLLADHQAARAVITYR